MKQLFDITGWILRSTFAACGKRSALVRLYSALSSLFSMSQGRQTGASTLPVRLSQPVRRNLSIPHGLREVLISLLLTVIATAPVNAATPPGSVINNTASMNFLVNAAGPYTVTSNTVTLTTTVSSTPSTIEFLKYAPALGTAELVDVSSASYYAGGSSGGGGALTSMAAPAPFGTSTSINLAAPVPLTPATLYHTGQNVFIRVTDLDQNQDGAARETLTVTVRVQGTAETEEIELTETGLNTGVFVAYMKTTTAALATFNGELTVFADAVIEATYTDSNDNTDVTAATALVDPYGVIFNSKTGGPVDGATVTLIDDNTGLPATVFGDDGVSTFPAAVISGGTTTDSAGKKKSYTFPPGYYRFPFVAPGNYRLQVTPPAGFRAPSQVPTAVLQTLPGAPFAIVNPGSRGEAFVVNPGPALHIDYPLDPVLTGLYIRKTAAKSVVAIGDFLRYKIEVENTTAAPVTNTTITDKMPLGFTYQKSSARLKGKKFADPTISDDGRTLTFNIGTLGALTSTDLTYVVEVAAGARKGEAVNTASATGDGGVTSNISKATVKIREDLFRSKNILMGRVFVGECGEKEQIETMGLGGIRVYMEDGTFIITDKEGRFHFKGVEPGVHVVQLDLDTIPPVYEITPCEENSRFAGRAYSQFVDLQGGTLWRTDFHLGLKPKMKGEVTIELKSSLPNKPVMKVGVLREEAPAENGEPKEMQPLPPKEEKSAKDIIDYIIPIEIGTVPLKNMRLTVILPEGVTYLPGSSSKGEEKIDDPAVLGNSLNYRIGDGEDGWQNDIRLKAEIPKKGKAGEIITRALLTFNTPNATNMRTPLLENSLIREYEKKVVKRPDITLRPHFDSLGATLTDEDKKELDDVVNSLKHLKIKHIFFTGHTDNKRIAPRSRHIFADNFALSHARAKSVADYVSGHLELPPEKITIEGEGPYEPIALNFTKESRALNRRVELHIVADEVIEWFHVREEKTSSGLKNVETKGNRPGEETPKPKEEKTEALSEYDKALKDVSPGTEMIWPKEDYVPPNYYLRVIVKHEIGETVKLFHEGEALHPIAFEGVVRNKEANIAKSIWRGLLLNEGDNLVEAVIFDSGGNETKVIPRNVHYSGKPVSAELVEEKSVLVADGKNPPLVAVRLFDADGKPVRKGLVGNFSVDPPHLPNTTLEKLKEDPISGLKKNDARYRVGEEGIALIKLAPTTKTGEFVVRMRLAEGEKQVRGWIEPEARDWILVGLAEGTVGYNTANGNMESLGNSGREDNLYEDERIAFYAKGRIKGKWLMTMAYDNKKMSASEREKLHQTIDPNSYYTLYGDGSEQQHDAASVRKLYLKIERGKFYALFGDFSTGMSLTELSRYNRNMNGFKSEMKGKRFDYNVYVAETSNAFVKDELLGDGTSGLYHLSRNNVVINSESVEIEVRDRFSSDVVLSSRKLARHLDYTIDYDESTIYFREPIYSRDEDFNPVYIVIDYETNNSSDMELNYGGRGAVKLMDDKVQIGASHIHEGTLGAESDLFGMDAKVKLTDKTKLRIEAATTDSEKAGVTSEGNAYIAEVSHMTKNLKGKVYLREMENGFGLGQQRGSETGMRKIGADGQLKTTEKSILTGNFYRQTNLSTDAFRDLAEIKSIYRERKYSLSAGLRSAVDHFTDGTRNDSRQLTLGATRSAFSSRLQLRAKHERSLLGNDENADFPTRTVLGTDYKLTQSLSLYADQEYTEGANEDTESTRLGLKFKASPWSGGEINSKLEQETTENGARVFSSMGLKQTWQINKKWSVDGGLDRADTLKHPGNKQLNLNTPAAAGSNDDFTALSLGLAFKEKKWSWAARAESRIADSHDKWSFFTGVNGELREGLGMAVGMKGFRTDYANGDMKQKGDLRFSVASRPKQSKWILLDRLDLIYDEDQTSGSKLDSRKIVNNLNANYKLTHKMQIALQYGGKYVKDNIDGDSYRGYTDLMGFEGRYDITKKVDLGLRGSMLHSWNSDKMDYGSGVSAGYNFAENIWVSLGYNFVGFRDKDFSAANYTAQGPYIRFRLKFDQQSARDLVRWAGVQ